MVRTFNDARDKKRERDSRTEGRGKESRPAPEDLRNIDWPDILMPSPDAISDEGVGRRVERREEAVNRIMIDLDNALFEDIGAGIGDIENAIRDTMDLDLSQLDSRELLAVIAESSRVNSVLNNVIMEQSITQLSVLNDIATAVEPAASVTVSGINSVSRAGVPEPVVPRSDEVTVATRRLWIRASPRNSDDMYFGDDKITPGNGFVLRPGESRDVQLDFRDSILWMASNTKGDEVQLYGVF